MTIGEWMLLAGAVLMFGVAFGAHLIFEAEGEAHISGTIFLVGLLLLMAGGIVQAVEGDAPASHERPGDELERYGGR